MIDLRSMRLGPGDVRHERPRVAVAPLTIAGQEYTVTPAELEPRLDLQAASGGLYLKLAFSAHVEGPCFRCLEPAGIDLDVRSSEYHSTDPNESDPELRCDYIEGDQLDVERWVRDALVFALPDKILDRPDCPGLCPECGQRRADLPADHGHETLDPRWAALRERSS